MAGNIWTNIAEVMHERGVNMSALAQGIGISPSAVTAWKSGATVPTMNRCADIAAFLGVPLERIMIGEQEPVIESELMSIYNELDREGQTMVLAEAYRQRRRMIDNGK